MTTTTDQPGVLLALVLTLAFGMTMFALVVTIGFAMVASSTRVIRGVALSLREAQFVDAARALGSSDMRVIVRHLIPNVMAPYLIMFSVEIGHAIVVEASLGFLGVGIQLPTPTWGQMLSQAIASFRLNPILGLAPGLAITLVVFGFNVLGDAMRDTFDPRLRGTGS